VWSATIQGNNTLEVGVFMKQMTQEQWIEKSKLVHGNVYDYSLVEYKRWDIKVKIICTIHNVTFEQTPNSHTNR
jgi:hypothetical protein